MKHTASIKITCLVALAALTCGCKQLQQVGMSGRNWFVSNHFGQVLDSDSLFRFSFGHNCLVDKDTPLIGTEDSLKSNPRLYRYAQEVLHQSRMDSAEVLFYAPKMEVMFVKLPAGYKECKPNSQSANMLDPRPWTGWVRDDDVEKWERQEDQMYTNLYYDKGKKRLVIVDRFNYGDLPVARIQIIQTRTKKVLKDFPNREITSTWGDLEKAGHLDAFSDWIGWHRGVSFENYRIGQENKTGKSWQDY